MSVIDMQWKKNSAFSLWRGSRVKGVFFASFSQTECHVLSKWIQCQCFARLEAVYRGRRSCLAAFGLYMLLLLLAVLLPVCQNLHKKIEEENDAGENHLKCWKWRLDGFGGLRHALILKIENKVAEVSGCPIHPDETALVGTLTPPQSEALGATFLFGQRCWNSSS